MDQLSLDLLAQALAERLRPIIDEQIERALVARSGQPALARKRSRAVGCTVSPSENGQQLTLRFRAPGPDGRVRRFRERTGLPPTPANYAKLKLDAEAIGAEIRSGRFEYGRWFPESAARQVARPRAAVAEEVTTLRDWYRVWIEKRRADRDAMPPRIRPSLFVAYRQHFEDHILPTIGDVPLGAGEPSRRTLEACRAALRTKGLTEKTIRNVIDGTLRAAVRDALRDDRPVTLDGFGKLDWLPYEPPEPTPFSENDRDRLLEYFRTKAWKVGGFNETRPHYAYFAFAYTLFYTALRPSEATAVRLEHVDLESDPPTIKVRASRHRGTEARPKTRAARRVVKLTAENAEILRQLVPLKATPDTHLFRDVRDRPIKPENFYHLFVDAQRALGMTPLRDLYSTKDTYVSWARRHHVNEAWLEDQTGVSIQTLKRHYGGVIHDPAWDRDELAKIERRPPSRAPRKGNRDVRERA